MNVRNPFSTLTKFEYCLWIGSLLAIITSTWIGGSTGWLSLVASLIGATSLIFVSKGDVFGQILVVLFSLLYAAISLQFRYYGEMITYLGMTAPIAILSVVTWLRHPHESGKPEVKISKLSRRNMVWMISLTVVVTIIFYGILAAFNTPSLLISTISIATSFLASYLMLFRSSAYALAYGANDLVLIALWLLACQKDLSYLPMVACFSIFLLNDLYGFFNWSRMMKRQTELKDMKQTLESV